MAFTALARVTDNYIRVNTFEVITGYLPVLLSQQDLNFLLTEKMVFTAPLINIVRFLMDLDSVNFNYKNGFLFINGKLSYYLAYVNNKKTVKARTGEILYDDFIDLRSILPENISQEQLDFVYQYSLNYRTYVINPTEIKLLVLLSRKIDIYQLQDLSIRDYKNHLNL